MVSKKKHRKQLAKIPPKVPKEEPPQSSADFDSSAYKVYQRFEMAYPCLSFDILKDDYIMEKGKEQEYPWSVRFVAGAQTHKSMENNYIYVVKVSDIKALKQGESDVDEDGINISTLIHLEINIDLMTTLWAW